MWWLFVVRHPSHGVSTPWQFGVHFDNWFWFAEDELASVFAGTETTDAMLKAIQSEVNAALSGG